MRQATGPGDPEDEAAGLVHMGVLQHLAVDLFGPARHGWGAVAATFLREDIESAGTF